METELKFRFTQEADQEALWRDERLKNLICPGSRRSTRMHSHYFDTCGQHLRRRMASLRVRSEGDAFVMTIKQGFQSGQGLHQRREWAVSVADDWQALILPRLDVDWFGKNATSDGDPAKLLEEILAAIRGQPLQEICQVRFLRTACDLAYGEALIELAFDVGELKAGFLREPLAELELELKAGEIGDLIALGEELSDMFKLVPEPLSKYARSLALATGSGK